MSYYSKGLNAPCSRDIVIPLPDDAVPLADSVDTARQLVSDKRGLATDVHSVANFLGGKRRSWKDYFNAGC